MKMFKAFLFIAVILPNSGRAATRGEMLTCAGFIHDIYGPQAGQFISQAQWDNWIQNTDRNYILSNGIHEQIQIISSMTTPDELNYRLQIIDRLLQRGAKIDGFNRDGKTPLRVGIENATHLKAIEFLLAKGANPVLKNQDGRTALEIAESQRTDDFVSRLRRSVRPETSSK
jgi:hypothetical protein